MMDEITRLNIDIALAKTGSLIAVLDDLRQCDAIWKDPSLIGRIDNLWKDIERLREELDNML